MFKLVKINGARINVPETMVFNIDGTATFTAGCLYYLTEEGLMNSPLSESDIKFIPIETVVKNSGKKKIHGFIVNDDMIFETDIQGDFNSVTPGLPLVARQDTNGSLCGVEASPGNDAMLISKESAAQNRKVLVALKW